MAKAKLIQLPSYDVHLIDYFDIYKQYSDVKVINDLHKGGFLGKKSIPLTNKTVKATILHHIIKDLCDFVINCKKTGKILIIFTEKCSQSLEIFNYCDKLGFIDFIQKQLKRYSKLLPINIHFSVYTTHQYSKIIAEKDGRAIETVIVLDTYVDRQQMGKLDYTKLSKVTKKDGLKFLSKTSFKKVENRQLIYM